MLWVARRRGADSPSAALPYRKKDYLLSRAGRSFYEVLSRAVADDYHVFPKIRSVDLLYLPKGTTGRRVHLNQVVRKHVDFVLCDHTAVAPILVVELDDASHERKRAGGTPSSMRYCGPRGCPSCTSRPRRRTPHGSSPRWWPSTQR